MDRRIPPREAEPVPIARNAGEDVRRARGKRTVVAVAGVLVAATVLAELLLRNVAGLGDPPLYRTDPAIEYVLVPGTYRRFGNTVFVNSVHMRSPESALGPRRAGERRVLVLGDSVVNGGSLTDQDSLATQLLPAMALELDGGAALTVCNVSAGSWGPGNLLAFVQRFGTFDSTDAVIVLNSEDAVDVPTFAALGPEQPTEPPLLALQELVQNYGARLLRRSSSSPTDPGASDLAAGSLGDLLDLLASRGVRCRLLFHPTRQQLDQGQDGSVGSLEAQAALRGVPRCSTADRLREMRAGGLEPYRDDIHPAAAGQAALAKAILDCLGIGR